MQSFKFRKRGLSSDALEGFFPQNWKITPAPYNSVKKGALILDKLLLAKNMCRMPLSFYFWSSCTTPTRFFKVFDQNTYIFFH